MRDATFLGRVSEDEKGDRLSRAHALIVTSVREGWGLVVTEAAAYGTVTVGYDVPGLRDSINASGGVLTSPDPTSLATATVELLTSIAVDGGPRVEPAGVVPWSNVAASILDVARNSGRTGDHVPNQVQTSAARHSDADGPKTGCQGLRRVRVGLALLGVLLLLIGGSLPRHLVSPDLVGAAFVALFSAVLTGALENWRLHSPRPRQSLPFNNRRARRQRESARASRTGIAIVTLVTTAAAQTWFSPGRLLAGGDIAPTVGTAWLGRVFSPWTWSGSNLGGPAANETNLPWAGVYWLVHALHGSPAFAERLWYTTLFTAAAVACYALLQVLGISTAASVIGALAFVFNAHVIDIGTNPVFLATMIVIAGSPAVVLISASGHWRLRTGIIVLGLFAPLLGYVSQNPPLTIMVGLLLASTPLLAAWLDGRLAAYRALRVVVFGGLLTALASSYWLIPTFLQISTDATGAIANPASWIWTEGRATLANGFWLNNDWGWKFTEYYPYAPAYNHWPMLILKYLLPAVSFSYMAWARFSSRDDAINRRTRLGIAVSATSLWLILLSTGTRFPGSIVFNLLYNLPYGWLLKEPGRFLMLCQLTYAILVALVVDACWMRVRNHLLPIWPNLWRSSIRNPLVPLVGASIASLAILIPAYPLITGAVAPTRRPLLPSTRVRVPAYWVAMASYINESAPSGNLLVLPQDDFYQMPYTWGYYGADSFITDLIARNVVDTVAQGYAPAGQELRGAVQLVQLALLDHDWTSVERALTAIGTPMILIREDVNTRFPGRHIASPADLARALRRDPGIRLVRRFGKLELFELRKPINPTGVILRYATVNSQMPDLRELSLIPRSEALISGPMRVGIPAVLQLPSVSQWQVIGNNLQASAEEPLGWHYRIRLLSPAGALRRSSYIHAKKLKRARGESRKGLSQYHLLIASKNGQLYSRIFSYPGKTIQVFRYRLGKSLLKNGNFASGTWGAVGNCAAFPGTTGRAALSARIVSQMGPTGKPVMELSARADSACEAHHLGWRSGALLISYWARSVTGPGPRVCILQLPSNMCASIAALSPAGSSSGWHRYQAIFSPRPGTKSLKLFLYADVYNTGDVTRNDYSDVVVRRAPEVMQPVILATPERPRGAKSELYAVDTGNSPVWVGRDSSAREVVDGLRSGWLTKHPQAIKPVFTQANLYLASRLTSIVAAGLVFVLALSLMLSRNSERR